MVSTQSIRGPADGIPVEATSPAAVAAGEVRETHVGVVVLIGEHALKVKKAVRTAFLDFSTPERRFAACQREVELNRRLAPDVYLGVVGVIPETDPSGRATASLAPALLEHVIVMRRMPDARCLATMIKQTQPVRRHLTAIARTMAVFHAQARRSPDIDVEGGRDALRRRWSDNLGQLEAYRGSVLSSELLDQLNRLVEQFLGGRSSLFDERIAGRRVVDGHGDLTAADIFCLDDGPRILDCLEFDDRLRYLDVLDDIAFLAMDIERLGHRGLADHLVRDYLEFSGDPGPSALLHHYIAYRAVVRAKVACLRHGQGSQTAAAEARDDAELGLRHLETGAVRLVLVGGLPGTGKTTVAGALADRFGAVMLSSDRIRKELAGLNPLQSAAAEFGEGLYSAVRTRETYTELLARAQLLLTRGESVVLDASWTNAELRGLADRMADATQSLPIHLQCVVSRETATRRIAARAGHLSDATTEIAAEIADRADPWPDAAILATGGSLAETNDLAASMWHRAALTEHDDRAASRDRSLAGDGGG